MIGVLAVLACIALVLWAAVEVITDWASAEVPAHDGSRGTGRLD